jgi:uncharacterized protein (TIGR00730 family)
VRSVCVFCGSSQGGHPGYAADAGALGTLLAARGIRLVYGGAQVGTMGALADAALAAGGEVVGVIPGHMAREEVAHGGLAELRVVDSMHERKATMARLADGFVALPGGLGTLDELAEILTWAQLGLHRKPVGLLDPRGFYNPLLRFLDHTVAEGFVRPGHRELLLVDRAPGPLLAAMAAWRPPDGGTDGGRDGGAAGGRGGGADGSTAGGRGDVPDGGAATPPRRPGPRPGSGGPACSPPGRGPAGRR